MILLALGSNLGPREALLEHARSALAAGGVQVLRASRILETPALMPPGAPASWDQAFLNQVLEVQTALSPLDLLDRTQAVEVQLGRRPAARWAPRVIDIDILAVGTLVIDDARLALPHPQMHLRRFVLQPLCELAPHWTHPVLGRTACELLDQLPP